MHTNNWNIKERTKTAKLKLNKEIKRGNKNSSKNKLEENNVKRGTTKKYS
jgi:hypothetical protein